MDDLVTHDADLQNQRCLGSELWVQWRGLNCATNKAQLEEEQDLFSSMRSSLQRAKCDWKKNRICSLRQDLLSKERSATGRRTRFVLIDEIFFAKNKVRLEEESQGLDLFLLCEGSCQLSPKGKDPGYVSKRIEKNIQKRNRKIFLIRVWTQSKLKSTHSKAS